MTLHQLEGDTLRVTLHINSLLEILPPVVDSKTGDANRGLKIISIERREPMLHILTEGLAGESYTLPTLHLDKVISITGGTATDRGIEITMPAGEKGTWVRKKIELDVWR